MGSYIFFACVLLAVYSCCSAIPLKFGSELKNNFTVLNALDSRKYADCKEILKHGYNESGVYWLHLEDRKVLIPCEFKDGNAFTVIMRRMSQDQTFVMPWQSYEHGFGHPQANYWAGLANIYAIAKRAKTKLQISMQDWSHVSENVLYSSFYLEPREVRYRLHVSGYQGHLADMLSYNNNMPFSTYDAPDPYGCAMNMKAGWWYNYCSYALPTGIYYQGGPYTPSGSMFDGIFWSSWHGTGYSLKFVSMTLIT